METPRALELMPGSRVALVTLAAMDGPRGADVGRELEGVRGMSGGHVYNSLSALEEEGLATKRTDLTDTRARVWSPTEEGRAVLEEYAEWVERAVADPRA